MNRVTLMGRLVADPTISTGHGKDGDLVIARYNLAVDRRGKDAGSDFISCVAFGKAGEFVEKYLHKGTKILIEGRIQTGSYENKDGKKVYTTDVVVESHEFCEKSTGTETTRTKPQNNDGFMSIADGLADEGLPFS